MSLILKYEFCYFELFYYFIFLTLKVSEILTVSFNDTTAVILSLPQFGQFFRGSVV